MKGGFHIADWEVQPQLNSLKREDKSFHVEPKVMQVLVELASHSDEVLSKERLIQAVWAGTFVSEDVLTRCISEIRRVLDDDARAPRFIQTIPKAGYRLIAPVEFPRESTLTTSAQSPPTTAPHSAARKLLAIALFVFLIAAALIVIWKSRSKAPLPTAYTILPFTFYPGQQTQPSFSPDGTQVAFIWNGGRDEHQHIYVKLIDAETPLRITNDAADDFSPTWSPDGHSIAFLRFENEERGIYIVPALGGTPRKVFTPMERIEWESGALSWAPDGKQLVFSDGKTSTSPSLIYSLDLTTGTAHAITSPPASWDGDASPAFSPDGSKIAFARGVEGWVRDVYVMSASGGSPVQLTSDGRMTASLAWSGDGNSIVFSSNRAGKFSLWRVPATGGSPERLPVGSEDAFSPTISRKGGHLAYIQATSNWSMKRLLLHTPKAKIETVWSASEQDSAPQISPSGQRIAFQSLRSGTQEVWVADMDGGNPVKLTSFGKSLTGSPSWSPDSMQLAFDARPEGRSHIFTIRLDGGQPRPLTTGAFNDIIPSWSRDGRWVYFGSNRSGAWQIWRVDSSGGEPVQVTKQGAFMGAESPDGKYLYYAKSDTPGIFRVALDGSLDEQRVVDQPRADFWGYWALGKTGIYFLNQSSSPMTIDFATLSGDHREHLATLDHAPQPYAGITVASDEKSLMYSEQTQADSHITLVNGFR